MSFRVVRQSKFRHVFGKEQKKDDCYDGLKLSRDAWDSPHCSVNSKFVAACLEAQGGGAFQVIPVGQTGRVDLNYPKVCGHTASVLDIQFCPYNDNLIASGSEDCTVKIWEIPDGGLTDDLRDSLVDLVGHQRRVGLVKWHPLAENIILTAGFDYAVLIWDIASPNTPVHTLTMHTDTIYSVEWNFNGSLLCTTSKDKTIRVIDPRKGTVLAEGSGHQGTKGSKAVFVSESNMIFTTGFSKMSERQYAIWNPEDLSRPLKLEMIDTGSGVLFPEYDPDTRMVYVSGKGDANVRYYEITDEPNVYFLSQFQSNLPQRGVAWFPKTVLDVKSCEVSRMIKLHPKGFIEKVSFTVPRKSTLFQDDLYPDTQQPVPVLSADKWLAGETCVPKFVSLKGGFKAAVQKTAVSKPAASKAAASEPLDDGSNAPKGEASLLKAWHSHEKEIADLKKQMATLNIKLRAAMKSLDNK